MIYNVLYLEAYMKIIKALNNMKAVWYPASLTPSYKELFNRDAFACIAVKVNFTPEVHYMFFNSSYDSTSRRLLFTSITMVSMETFLLKSKGKHFCKCHIENTKDIEDFINKLTTICSNIEEEI